MSSYLRAYNDGVYDAEAATKREAKNERDAEWSEALAPLAAICNAWEIDPGRGEPCSPDDVSAWSEAIAADLYAKLGEPKYGDELPEALRRKYDRHYREDCEAEEEIGERDRLMGEFWKACRDGLPTLDLEVRLARLDVSEEWVENTRAAARGAM